MSLWNDIDDLPREDLVDLLKDYDDYIENAREFDLFHDGWVPVCLAEFYEAEFRMPKDGGV